MRFLRARHRDQDYWGDLYDEATIRLWTGAPYDGGEATDRFLPLRNVRTLPPCTPSKIVCVGRNYRRHAEELGNDVPSEPLLFLKPPSALLAPHGTVLLPPQSDRVEHEAELALVVGRRASRISEDDALLHVFAYTIANDVTARDLQKRDVQFTRGKGFDTFCPVGPWLETELDPADLRVRLFVDEELRQDGRTSAMVFSVRTLIHYISSVMTLLPGDLLLTGTPAGVGPLRPADRVTIEIDGLGRLEHAVAARQP
ncbi:MAG: fumarylacetoacetate hydrolase family protein [Myxococcota bacterium]